MDIKIHLHHSWPYSQRPYFEVSPTHKARTWLLDPRAPQVEPPEHIRELQREGVRRYGK